MMGIRMLESSSLKNVIFSVEHGNLQFWICCLDCKSLRNPSRKAIASDWEFVLVILLRILVIRFSEAFLELLLWIEVDLYC